MNKLFIVWMHLIKQEKCEVKPAQERTHRAWDQQVVEYNQKNRNSNQSKR